MLVLLALAGAGCARLSPDLVLPALGLQDPAWERTVEAHVGAPILAGNAVDLLLNGSQIFPAMLDAIAGARRTITYEQFIYKAGGISRRVAEAFAERCRAGVRVHLLFDGWGVRWIPREDRALLEEAGCRFAVFRPLRHLDRANYRNHRRILVVDGEVGFTGGSGVGPQWVGDGVGRNTWRETDVRVRGPVVQYLQAAFAEHWAEATGALLGGEAYYPPLPPAGTVRAQVVRSAPVAGNFAMYRLLMLAIAGARRSIHITNQYLVLDDAMTAALVEARRRGVEVVIIVPGTATNRLVFAAGRAGMGRLLEAGIEIHAYRAGLLHAKTMVVDGVWATIGSTNLDPRALRINDELNVVVYDRELAGRMEEIFAADLERSERLTYEAWRDRGLWLRFLGWLTAPIRSQL